MNSNDKAKNQEQLEAHQRLALSPFHTLLKRQTENLPEEFKKLEETYQLINQGK